jgi:hypothetical protein
MAMGDSWMAGGEGRGLIGWDELWVYYRKK